MADVRHNQIDKSVTAFRQGIVTVTYPKALHRQKFIHPRVSLTVDGSLDPCHHLEMMTNHWCRCDCRLCHLVPVILRSTDEGCRLGPETGHDGSNCR